ncbi:MAG: NAD(P)/FAD-dependent oxidoreductase [Propionicimonas sp.]|nr:NAD(P)/FAD-dependent oxidoreductase [Propionicimonas sp.]
MPGWDAVIIGGGHNGLTAAGYLARAGRRVLVLERSPQLGGAAVSQRPFAGVDARLSRYSYLVSLLPRQVIDDLGLRVTLLRRRFSSYTPDPSDPARGLLVDGYASAADAARGFARIGAWPDAVAWADFYRATARIARTVFPSLLEPLATASELRRRLGSDELWDDLTGRPLAGALEDWFGSDLVRGVVATDGLIGTFASLTDTSLEANRCFLYHVIGGGTGDWDVPVGGMGQVSAELARVARAGGAVLRTGAEVTAVDADDAAVTWSDGAATRTERAGVVLSAVAPAVLDRLLGRPSEPPVGSQVKVNLVLTRLPRLRDPSVRPEEAFAGTFHVNEGYSRLEAAYRTAAAGTVPDPLPCEVYCHTLSDPGILSGSLQGAGFHTMTVFGLHTPHHLVTALGATARESLQEAVLASLNSVLAEPVQDLLASDADGRPCIETRTTADLEAALGMPGGHIFHGPLAWPWAAPDEPLDTPAQRWGVSTGHPRVLCCGAGAVRGGGVSGIAGQNAAMAVLQGSRN